jgi:hypothetical protein
MAIVQAGSTGWENFGTAILFVVAAGGALMMFFGFVTPAGGLLIAGTVAGQFFLERPDISFVFLFVLAIVVIFLGPGAVSVDARLFGRREIIIPDD